MTIDFQNPENIKMCLDWVVERHRIHKKKDIEKLDPPWTTHEGFDQHYCNVKRRLDRESKNVINAVCLNPDLSLSEKMINCVLFRMINKFETFSLLGLPRKESQGKYTFDELEEIDKRVKEYMFLHPNFCPFTNAYMVSGQIKGLNIKCREMLSEEEYVRCEKLDTATRELLMYNMCIDKMNEFQKFKSAEDLFKFFEKESLLRFGTFLEYQIFLDWTYCPEYKVSDNESVISGPGCDYGLQVLYGLENIKMSDFKSILNKNNLNCEELLKILRDNTQRYFEEYRDFDGNKVTLEELFDDMPPEERNLRLNDWENIMCEFSKYYRQFYGGKKIKRHYDFSKYSVLDQW